MPAAGSAAAPAAAARAAAGARRAMPSDERARRRSRMRKRTLQSASPAPPRRCETGFDAARPAPPPVDVRTFPAKNLACYRRTFDWPADCLEIESRAIVRAGASRLPPDRPLMARVSIVRVRDRAPSSRPDGSAPVMSLGAGQAGAASHTANDASRSFAHGGRRAEIAPLARRPAGHSSGACSANAGNAISRDAPQRHRRLAAFRSDDFDRASRRTMAHGRRSIRLPMRRAALRRRSTPIDIARFARSPPAVSGADAKPEWSRSSDCQKAADYTGRCRRKAHGAAQFFAEKRRRRRGRNRFKTGSMHESPARKRIIRHTQTLPYRFAHRHAPRAATNRLAVTGARHAGASGKETVSGKQAIDCFMKIQAISCKFD